MKRTFKRLFSMFILILSFALILIPYGQQVQADDHIITIVHTNDMHGRLNQTADNHTLLSRLRFYVDFNNVDFLFDAGDAIQGLAISNLNKGEKMLEAMADIGYDAMTIGNHEFDFGLNNILDLESKNLVPMVSNNVVKDGALVFDRTMTIIKDSVKLGVIGVTTPETSTKTHPNNVIGVNFNDPFTEVKKDLDALILESPDLIVVLAHLGVDSETPELWRGNYLAAEIAKLELEIPVLVIDGHSHTAFEEGVNYGDTVLYVQTGEYLNNIGRVDINLEDFSLSTAQLVATDSITIGGEYPNALLAETQAQTAFNEIAQELVFDGLPFTLSSNRDIVRRREAAFGNLITDAMLSYGQNFTQKPDLAIINGGGIRADLSPGAVTVGDVISVLPYGNIYSSIEMTGQDILDMFEFSYSKMPTQDENGIRVLDVSGGFLQVAGARVVYNAAKPVGSRIESVWLEKDNALEPLDLNAKYILATNDFLAVGGDGFSMLGGARIEGASLDDVFKEFLSQHGESLDWDLYKNQTPRTRIFHIEVQPETMAELEETLANAMALINDSDDYPVDAINKLQGVIGLATLYLDNLVDYSEEGHDIQIAALKVAIEEFEDSIIPETSTEPETTVPETTTPETTTPETTTPETTTPETTTPETPDEDGKLPDTGVTTLIYPGIALMSLGVATIALSKRKKD